jgi:CBS-domain-containing membrane protein
MSLGLLCSLPLRMGWVTSGVSVGLLGATAVSLSLFAMAVFDIEHPPAASNALAFAISSVTWEHVAFTRGAVCLLSLVRRLLRGWLRDLA